MKVVILAGGKGTRLKPYTTVFPKPLMPVGDRPILEIIIQQLKSQGFDEIIITVGHLSELVMAFFGSGQKLGVNIKYAREPKPMGTAGGLSLLREELKESFLVMNGDILTTLNLSDLVRFHKKEGAFATIALNKRHLYIDFGTVCIDGHNNIESYAEKPVIEHLVSMGICVFEPRVLDYIEPDEKLDLPDLVGRLTHDREMVKGYVFEGYWLDIGRPEDYERANREIDDICDKLG